MCNPTPTIPSSFLCPKKPMNKTMDPYNDDDQEEQLHRWPTPSEALQEIKEIGKISGPTAMTGLILYSRAMISMLFLGYLGRA
ncbi:hypothetical protein OIU76_007349 [Salix suchowensis]|nr:hypothetical protein OIU76_007349 [Salix suchowensis]